MPILLKRLDCFLGYFSTVGLDLRHQRKESFGRKIPLYSSEHTHSFIIHKKLMFLLDCQENRKYVFAKTIVWFRAKPCIVILYLLLSFIFIILWSPDYATFLLSCLERRNFRSQRSHLSGWNPCLLGPNTVFPGSALGKAIKLRF